MASPVAKSVPDNPETAWRAIERAAVRRSEEDPRADRSPEEVRAMLDRLYREEQDRR